MAHSPPPPLPPPSTQGRIRNRPQVKYGRPQQTQGDGSKFGQRADPTEYAAGGEGLQRRDAPAWAHDQTSFIRGWGVLGF